MANSMNLPIPVVGVDTGPNWANAINNCMALIAEHTHASGSGVQVTPTGLNINAPLLFNGNPLQSAAYLNMLPQGVGIPVPINGSLYINGVDLFFRDGAGNNITITQGGNVLAGSTGIISGTATASFVGSVFTILQAPGIRAHVDASSYVFKYNGSYQAPPANSVVLQAPTSIAGSFALTLPTGLPGINNAIMVSNTVGQLTFITSDTAALAITATGANSIGLAMTSVGANSIATNITVIPAANANVIANARTRSVGASVGIGGVAISPTISNYQNITSTPTTAATVTISTSGRPVMLMIQNDASAGTNSFMGIQRTAASPAAAVGNFFYFRDGVQIASQACAIQIGVASSGFQTVLNSPSQFSFVDFPSVGGPYVYTIRGASTGLAGEAIVINKMVLVAYEL